PGPGRRPQGPSGRCPRQPPARRGRQPAPPRAADAYLQEDGTPTPHPPADRRRLVPLLRRPRAQADGLLRLHPPPHQRRRRPDRLLLRGPQGLLRPVLPDQGAVLSPLAIVLGATALLAGVTGAWSPCGFSMVDTLSAAAREHGRRVLPPALLTFSLGA